MPQLAAIEPKTTAILAVTFKQGGVAETGGAVTATIYNPDDDVIATNVVMPHQGAGVFNLSVLPAWSTGPNGEAIQGVFTAECKAIAANGKQRVRRFTYPVFF